MTNRSDIEFEPTVEEDPVDRDDQPADGLDDDEQWAEWEDED